MNINHNNINLKGLIKGYPHFIFEVVRLFNKHPVRCYSVWLPACLVVLERRCIS